MQAISLENKIQCSRSSYIFFPEIKKNDVY